MQYWQGMIVVTAILVVFFGSFSAVAFLRRSRRSPAGDWQEDMAMRAREFVNRHGCP